MDYEILGRFDLIRPSNIVTKYCLYRVIDGCPSIEELGADASDGGHGADEDEAGDQSVLEDLAALLIFHHCHENA
jgi:hypothetical protein